MLQQLIRLMLRQLLPLPQPHYGSEGTAVIDADDLRGSASDYKDFAMEAAATVIQEEEERKASDAAAGGSSRDDQRDEERPMLASRFLQILSSNGAFCLRCKEWLKVGQIALIMIPVSVEDERLFSALNFIKSDLRNRLINPNLTNAVRIDRFRQASFPYDEALDHWQGVKTRRSVTARM